MNRAACRWILSSLLMLVSVYGSHTILPYSIVDLTNDIYAVFLYSRGQYFRFLRKKPKVELAFLATFEICVVHLRSSDICKPKYGLF